MAAYPIVKIQTSFVQAQPSIVSVLSGEGLKVNIVPCLGIIRTQPNEHFSSVEFVVTQLPESVGKEKQPNTTPLLLNDKRITGSAENRIGQVLGAPKEPAETYLLLTIEQATLGRVDAGKNGLTIVRPEFCQTETTPQYAVNSESPAPRLWSDTESYGRALFQPQASATLNSIWLSTFLRNLTEKTNSASELASNEPATFDNTIIQLILPPPSHLPTPQEPVYFCMVLLGFAGNNNHPALRAIILAMFPPPLQGKPS